MFDTIASIATALSPSGIGIIRLSGNESIAIADRIFVPTKKDKRLVDVKSHTLHYGHIKNPKDGTFVDEVLVSVMIGPHSYTKEDVVEINCHGGILVLEQTLKLILDNGARLAEPGEFTKRAFLNGRMDLSQAEAVIDMINAKTSLSLKASVNQLSGQLKKALDDIKEETLALIAHIEAAIDYPEYELEALAYENMTHAIESVDNKVMALIQSYDNGKLIRDGIKTAIIGKPNVGKSSLLNAMLRENRAIVTNVPGTTRDVLEEYMNIHGIPIKLIDTAGIRLTEDVVEKIGIEKSKEKLSEADLIILMLDGSRPLDDEDRFIISLLHDKEVLCLINKIDLTMELNKSELEKYIQSQQIIEISAKHLEGIDQLEGRIKEMFYLGELDVNNDVYITNVRHKHALEASHEALIMVKNSIESGMPEDCYAIDLKQAYEQLGTVTGDFVREDMINEIFSRFCLGK